MAPAVERGPMSERDPGCFECSVYMNTVLKMSSRGSPQKVTVTVTATVAHSFECLANATLLRLRFGDESHCAGVAFLPFCVTTPTSWDGTTFKGINKNGLAATVDDAAYMEGSEVLALCLSEGSSSSTGCKEVPGTLKRVATGPRVWLPEAFHAAFPEGALDSDEPEAEQLWFFLKTDPEPALIGIGFRGSTPKASPGCVLPGSLLACACPALQTTLVQFLHRHCGRIAGTLRFETSLLRQLETRWSESLRREAALVLWSIERGDRKLRKLRQRARL